MLDPIVDNDKKLLRCGTDQNKISINKSQNHNNNNNNNHM